MPETLIDGAVNLAKTAAPRAVLGLAGPPAAGKSTLSVRIVEGVNRHLGEGTAAYLPMDGFHLSNAQLEILGLRHCKGAPDTFDVHGYLALLQRLRVETEHPVYIADYDRALHEPVAARLVVSPGTRLVVTEGNYLADDGEGWREVRTFLRELWYVDTPDEVREERLARRQMDGGRNAEAAWEWVRGNDRPNGERVKKTRVNCTRVVSL
ncbi:nucleoside/nucleotide kinase family protein [Streptomyces sp. NBC_00564]|uniref:nucleoside/nucleotide kinase family protein n=1 Tax=Streptomyces sp. NBC_00564 TaxID=2903663 RepID=UPI00352D38AC|nr:nucleoside/nucleotide kinase family protein [Streptomyces sp. NBC_00564]